MILLIAFLAWSVALAVLIPAAVFFLETVASFLPGRKKAEASSSPSIAVIVPAHNEGAHIADTVNDLRANLHENDRLIVVADNCTDNTAEIARSLGAEAIIRTDPDNRGKGYALQFAIDHLRAAPPDCVAFFDADCRIKPGTVRTLANAAMSYGRPAQALNIMEAPQDASPRISVAAFAWVLINKVRMTGLYKIAGVTRFTGTGMASPWPVISNIEFSTGAINEDLLLTFKFAEAGVPPLFNADAQVTSSFPDADEASVTQRARWEHGSLNLLLRYALPALWRGIVKFDIKLVMLALDAMIPPLVVFAGLLVGAFIFSAVLWPVVGTQPFSIAALAMMLFAFSIVAGWASSGRDALPASQIWAIVPFVLEKFHIYGRRGRDSSKTWTRTKRQGEDE